MPPKWPWPGDTKDDRYRRIIDHYRTALADIDLEACLVVDKKMAEYGQPWVSDNSIIDVNEMLSAKQLAERFGLSEWNVRDWARRHPERIRKHKAANGRTLFRVGDVLTYHATKGSNG
ncbi:excise [Mycobacterium phage DyoEdafos]|uniref:Excise n=1 Tax=Mycobacterium phage DyoEdafos TaxID=2599860 RepID=A0A5J6TJY9_9CAUD|nr:excise [Mycobacterium phage DyoEdafos]QFG10324.1 excise [Mycobacterium phage DyoEdafos]